MKNVTIYFILFIFFSTSFMHYRYFIIIHANTINNSQCLMFAVVIALNYSRTTVTSCMYVVYYIYILHVGTVYFLIFLGLKNVLGTNCSTRHTFLKSYGRCSLAHARFYFTMQHKTNNLA